ncbi:MAG: hypothetical protein UV60_C0003G0011 [Parcubacteria group bacterium GW2011_GWA2_43_11]|nr:MAG: hypothetical protein UU89_C0010G0011 [Parcubacteria group bacterium GW2011_GWC2_42_11]KKS86093.1 MAG: hypothetical protein UV60_C0003G0011 [Parcubacteria group bacterium GW2011_GWA2_43_11]
MRLTHVTLAVASGIALLGIVGMVYIANTQIVPPEQEVEKNTKNRIPVTTDQTSPPDVQSSPEGLEEKAPLVEDAIRAGATLNLRGQNLQEVPQYVFQRLGIEKLDLSHNILEGALQAEIRHLSELVVLDLSYNAFTGVPAEIGQLTKLEVLNLSNNNLTGLPYEIGNLQNLTQLDLRGNTAVSQNDIEIIRERLPQSTEILVD